MQDNSCHPTDCKRLLFLLHVPVMVTTAFHNVEKPSQLAQSNAISHFQKWSPQHRVPLSSQMLNWRTTLRLCASQLVSIKVAVSLVLSNRPKKLNLVQQTIFLVRGVVWARDYCQSVGQWTQNGHFEHIRNACRFFLERISNK